MVQDAVISLIILKLINVKSHIIVYFLKISYLSAWYAILSMKYYYWHKKGTEFIFVRIKYSFKNECNHKYISQLQINTD